MIYSMTGYASKTLQLQNIRIQLEIKSVNHRFLDLTLKSAEEFKPLETALRTQISQNVSRGKIDIRIFFRDCQDLSASLHLNQELLNHYIKLFADIKSAAGDIRPSSISEILAIPGILSQHNLVIEEIQPQILAAFDTLITEFNQSQQAEGSKLIKILLQKLNEIQQIISGVNPLLAASKELYQQKLKQRLADFLQDSEINDLRLQQEVAFFCQKMDVSEEIDRLTAHTEEFNNLLEKGGQIGKRLDFICQEMHREANTFGSKSVSIDTTRKAVELKVLIEQIREQVQNIM